MQLVADKYIAVSDMNFHDNHHQYNHQLKSIDHHFQNEPIHQQHSLINHIFHEYLKLHKYMP